MMHEFKHHSPIYKIYSLFCINICYCSFELCGSAHAEDLSLNFSQVMSLTNQIEYQETDALFVCLFSDPKTWAPRPPRGVSGAMYPTLSLI